MGLYADRIKRGHEAQHLSDADIRAAKCQRSHNRNVERKAAKRDAAEARNAKTPEFARRAFRRANGLKEFAKSA